MKRGRERRPGTFQYRKIGDHIVIQWMGGRIFWIDEDQKRRLYHVLLDESGPSQTAPTFIHLQGFHPRVHPVPEEGGLKRSRYVSGESPRLRPRFRGRRRWVSFFLD
jgi:hypothetical protein